MPSCEKCWEDSRDFDGTPRYEAYKHLVETRSCTPEEQAGPYAEVCDSCGRKTVHQYARVCVSDECQPREEDDE